jgi:DNA-binding CsgD family transcriptional regulator
MDGALQGRTVRVGLDEIEEENRDIVFDWVTRETKARLIFDRSMRLLWANEAAHEMLLHGAHIGLGDEGVVVRSDELRIMIEQAIRARTDESLFVIEHSDDIGSDLLVRFERLRDDAAKACFGLQLIRHAPTPGGWSEMLAAHFQLTPKQTHVLIRMVSGESGEDIAKAMRISVETVRTHVRDVYAKMRVSSREELFVRVRPFYM